MYSNTIDGVLKRLWPKVYIGTFAVDKFPSRKEKKKRTFVYN